MKTPLHTVRSAIIGICLLTGLAGCQGTPRLNEGLGDDGIVEMLRTEAPIGSTRDEVGVALARMDVKPAKEELYEIEPGVWMSLPEMWAAGRRDWPDGAPSEWVVRHNPIVVDIARGWRPRNGMCVLYARSTLIAELHFNALERLDRIVVTESNPWLNRMSRDPYRVVIED